MRRWQTILLTFTLCLPFVSAIENPWKKWRLNDIFRNIYDFIEPLLADDRARTVILAIIILALLYNVIVVALAKTPLAGPQSKKIAFILALLSTLSLFWGAKTRDMMLRYSYMFLWILLGVWLLRIVSKVLGKIGFNSPAGTYRHDERERRDIGKNEKKDEKKSKKNEKEEERTEEEMEHEEKGEIKEASHALKLLKKIKKEVKKILDILESEHPDVEEVQKLALSISKNLILIEKYAIKMHKDFLNEKQCIEELNKDQEIEAVLDKEEEKLVEEDKKIAEDEEYLTKIKNTAAEKRTDEQKRFIEDKTARKEQLDRVIEDAKKLWRYAVLTYIKFFKYFESLKTYIAQTKGQINKEICEKIDKAVDILIPMMEKEKRILKRRKHLISTAEKLT